MPDQVHEGEPEICQSGWRIYYVEPNQVFHFRGLQWHCRVRRVSWIGLMDNIWPVLLFTGQSIVSLAEGDNIIWYSCRFFIFYVVDFVWFCCILFVMLICLDITLMSFWCPCIIWCPHVQLVLHLFPGQSFHCPVSLWTFYGPSRLYPDSVQFLCSHNGQSSFLILRADTLQTLASHQPVKHSEANRNKIGQSKNIFGKGNKMETKRHKDFRKVHTCYTHVHHMFTIEPRYFLITFWLPLSYVICGCQSQDIRSYSEVGFDLVLLMVCLILSWSWFIFFGFVSLSLGIPWLPGQSGFLWVTWSVSALGLV